jgi:hypothetical protein
MEDEHKREDVEIVYRDGGGIHMWLSWVMAIKVQNIGFLLGSPSDLILQRFPFTHMVSK